jgi:hypothetical protein
MFSQRQQLTTENDNQVCGITELFSAGVLRAYLGFLLLTSHYKKFCRRMNNIDLFEDSRRVICQSLFSKMIHNEFKPTIWTQGGSYNFGEFVDRVDVT